MEDERVEVETTYEEVDTYELEPSSKEGYLIESEGGSSKGLMALVAGAVIATGVGIFAWRRHKKKKKEEACDEYEDDFYEDGDYEEVEPEEVVEIQEETEKSEKKKK